MTEKTSAVSVAGRQHVGVGPGAGGRRSGSRGRDHGARRQEDWSGFAKGLLSGVFITLSLGLVALGAWFRTDDGSPHRSRLPAALGGISASIAGPEGGHPHEASDIEVNSAAGSARPAVPPGESGAAKAPSAASGDAHAATGAEQGKAASAQPEAAPDELEAMGVNDLLKAQERNSRVVGRAGKLLKAIGGSGN